MDFQLIYECKCYVPFCFHAFHLWSIYYGFCPCLQILSVCNGYRVVFHLFNMSIFYSFACWYFRCVSWPFVLVCLCLLFPHWYLLGKVWVAILLKIILEPWFVNLNAKFKSNDDHANDDHFCLWCMMYRTGFFFFFSESLFCYPLVYCPRFVIFIVRYRLCTC